MYNLPTEILKIIFLNLPSRDLGAIACVNRQYHFTVYDGNTFFYNISLKARLCEIMKRYLIQREEKEDYTDNLDSVKTILDYIKEHWSKTSSPQISKKALLCHFLSSTRLDPRQKITENGGLYTCITTMMKMIVADMSRDERKQNLKIFREFKNSAKEDTVDKKIYIDIIALFGPDDIVENVKKIKLDFYAYADLPKFKFCPKFCPII